MCAVRGCDAAIDSPSSRRDRGHSRVATMRGRGCGRGRRARAPSAVGSGREISDPDSRPLLAVRRTRTARRRPPRDAQSTLNVIRPTARTQPRHLHATAKNAHQCAHARPHRYHNQACRRRRSTVVGGEVPLRLLTDGALTTQLPVATPAPQRNSGRRWSQLALRGPVQKALSRHPPTTPRMPRKRKGGSVGHAECLVRDK